MSTQSNPPQDKNIQEQISELRSLIITLEKATEDFNKLDEALHEFQNTITHFTEISSEGIVVVQDFKYVWVNRAACEILGYSEQDLLALSVKDTTGPDMRNKAESMDKQMLSGMAMDQPTEWLALKGDRTLRYLKAFGYRIKFRGRAAVLSVFYDVTEERKMRDELQLQSQILDLVTDSVFMLDKNGKIVYVNEAAYTTRGYSKTELLGKSIIDITPDAYKRRAKILLNQFSEHKSTRFDTAHICKDGSEMLIEVDARAIRINKSVHYLGVAREKRKAIEYTVG
jgi:PAS domain S-box-containing protein